MAYFPNKRQQAFVKKKIIKISPYLLLKTKHVQFSFLEKVTRKQLSAIQFEGNLLSELHVFQKLRESQKEYEESVN